MATFEYLVSMGHERMRIKCWNRNAFLKVIIAYNGKRTSSSPVGSLYDPIIMALLDNYTPVPVYVGKPEVVAGDDWEVYTGTYVDHMDPEGRKRYANQISEHLGNCISLQRV